MSVRTGFWTDFFDEYYEKRPTVLNLSDLEGVPFSESQAASVIRKAFSREHGRTYVPQERRFHIDFRPVDEPYLDDEDLPRPHEPLRSYFERLYKKMGAQDLTLVAHNCHQFERSLFFAARSFFKPLFDVAGIPSFMVGTDLFAGKYRTGANNVHKDMGAVFIFPLISRKSIICWPFDYFAHLTPDAHYKNAGLPGVRAEDFERDATILSAEPGQAIYFPAHWWHAAYSHDLEATCTLNVTLYLSSTIESVVSPVLKQLLDEMDGALPRIDHIAPAPSADGVIGLDSIQLPDQLVGIGSRIERALKLQQLKRASGAGFVTGLGNFEVGDARNHGLIGDPAFPVLAVSDGAQELLVANGRVFQCPHTEAVLRSVARVNSGKVFRPEDLEEPELLPVLISCGSVTENAAVAEPGLKTASASVSGSTSRSADE